MVSIELLTDGGLRFYDDKNIRYLRDESELPDDVAEKFAVLRAVDPNKAISGVGERIGANVFIIHYDGDKPTDATHMLTRIVATRHAEKK